MDRHVENAKAIATLLEEHDQVEKVYYPGLESHPQFALAKEQMRGPGGMISFVLDGSVEVSTEAEVTVK